MRPREPELLLGRSEDRELHDAAHAGGLRCTDDVGLASICPSTPVASRNTASTPVERGDSDSGRA
jgi:hypothetical protein